MLLAALTEEQKTYLHAQCARGFSVPKALAALAERWPNAKQYTSKSVRDYLKSEDGQERGTEIIEELRKQALENAFADRGSRLDLLNERATSLANQLREIEAKPNEADINPKPPADPADVAKLNGELRQTLDAMKKEMDPLSEGERAVAPILQAMQQMAVLGTTPAQQRARMEAQDAEVPS